MSKPQPNQIVQSPLKNATNSNHRIKIIKKLKKPLKPVPPCAKAGKKRLVPDRRKQPAQQQVKRPLKLNNPKAVVHRIKRKKTNNCKPIPLQSNLTKKVILDYGVGFGEDSTRLELLPPLNCLKYHNISPALRARMVNWMVEVTSVFEIQPLTFFTAVRIMDLFYANTRRTLDSDDVHLTGIVSMFIASKLLDSTPLRMNRVVAKIGHNTFTVGQVKDKEKEMLQVLGFFVVFPTVLTFAESFVEAFLFNHPDIDEKRAKILEKVKRHIIYFGKLAMYEYSLLKYRYFLI